MTEFEQMPAQTLESKRASRAPHETMVELLYEQLDIPGTIEAMGFKATHVLHQPYRQNIVSQITAHELTIARIDREIAALERELGIKSPRDPEPVTHPSDERGEGEDSN